MAVDKTAEKNANVQDIDLDDVEVVILIIAKTPAKITQAANFLTRRGWPTTTLNNLSQAIEFSTDRKPDFVLISVNHPNPAISKFSDLLTSTFGATCVAFAESLDNASNARLAKSSILAKIQGQASGPNLHRSLRKLLAEKLNIQLDDKGQVRDTGATEDKGPTTIKGERSAAGEDAKIENESVSTGKYKMSKANRRTLRELSQNPLDKPGDVELGEERKKLAAKLKKSLFGDAAEMEVVPDPVSEAEEAEQAETPTVSRRMSGMTAGGLFTQESGISGKSNQGLVLPTPPAEARTSLIMPDAPNAAVQPPRARAKMKSLASVGPHSLVERAVQTALAQICRPSVGDTAPIQMIEQVGVFPVDSPSLPGYLVIAWPHEEMRAIEPFFNQAQQILATTFKDMGLQARLESGFFVTLPQVDFGEWAAKKSAFSFSTSHGAEEIGVAFFGTDRPIPKPQAVEDQAMYSIGLEHIPAEAPVTFKVYLHLKKNKKYFLYLRNGRQMQTKQKARLENGQVKDLYMKTIDAENLRSFLATCYLSDIIKKAG